jgi:hypothetical protein
MLLHFDSVTSQGALTLSSNVLNRFSVQDYTLSNQNIFVVSPIRNTRSSDEHHLLRGNSMYVGFGVLTAVVMKSSIFWDTTPRSPFKANRSFGGIFRLHFQGRRISLLCLILASHWFLPWIILRPWRWRQHVPPELQLTFNELHGVISQKRNSS